MKRFPRTLLVYLAIGMAVLFLGSQLFRQGDDRKELTQNQFDKAVDDGDIDSATFKDRDNKVEGELRDGTKYVYRYPAESADEPDAPPMPTRPSR